VEEFITEFQRRSILSEQLAQHLGLPDNAFDAMGVGYDSQQDAYTFPERDHEGRCCGIVRRYLATSNKVAITGSTRGLTIPGDWERFRGPLLLPEGASDTLTATTLGLSAVGRPNSKGGIDILKRYLSCNARERTIIILAERDQKADGSWPGRDGALATAQAVANYLQRPVWWAFPPEPWKDLRSWVISQEPDLWATSSPEILDGLRRRLLDEFMDSTAIVEPSAVAIAAAPT
jgi:hypothetical protein